MSKKVNADLETKIKGWVTLFVIILIIGYCSSRGDEDSNSYEPNKRGIYIPKNYSMFAASEECHNSAISSISANDKEAWNILALEGCIFIYESSKMDLKFVLLKVGGVGKPNLYYVQGNPNEKYWAYPDVFE